MMLTIIGNGLLMLPKVGDRLHIDYEKEVFIVTSINSAENIIIKPLNEFLALLEKEVPKKPYYRRNERW